MSLLNTAVRLACATALCGTTILSPALAETTSAEAKPRPKLIDWSEVSYERDQRFTPRDSWELSYEFSRFFEDFENFNDEFDSDNFHLFRLRYRYNDRVSRSFEKFYRFDVSRRIAFESSDDNFTRFSALGGLRYRFSSGVRLDFPLDINYSDFENSDASRINIGFSPDIRLPFGRGHTLRLRTDIETNDFTDDDTRDNFTFRVRPGVIIRTPGPFTYEAELSFERRDSRADFESRDRFRADLAAIYEIPDSENFWELEFRYEDTDEDEAEDIGDLPLDEWLVSLQLSYNWYPESVNGLELSAGVGYEYVDTESENVISESPFIVLGASKRF